MSAGNTDSHTLTDPTSAMREIAEDAGDLSAIYKGTDKIVNEFSGLYRNIYAVTNILDQTDYETVIGFITDAKCAQVRNYEKEFGEPAPFPRPKNCK